VRQRVLWLSLILIATMLFSCGKKTAPKPPPEVRPVPPRKVRVTLHFWGAELSFKIPRRKVDGRPLDGLKGFEIIRYGETIEGPKTRFRRKIWVSLSKEEFERLKELVYHDRSLRSGLRYRYVIRAVRGWRCVSDPAVSPTFAWHSPPKAPKKLEASAGDTLVSLRWTPVRLFLDGTELVEEDRLRYRIYRRFQDRPLSPLPELVSTTNYTDRDVVNEVTYCYRVAGVYEYFGSLIEGPKSPEACATPHDVTPPRPPEGLVAVPVEGGVLLRWRRNGEQDLWGYHVYRKVPGKPAERLTSTPIPEPKFLDTKIPGPGLYYYWVTAVDRSPRHNESAPSERVSVEILPKEED